MSCNICGDNFYGICPHQPTKVDQGLNRVLEGVLTPPRGEPMPRTIEHYIARGDRDQELILKMKDEISNLKVRNDRLEKKLLQRKG